MVELSQLESFVPLVPQGNKHTKSTKLPLGQTRYERETNGQINGASVTVINMKIKFRGMPMRK